MCKNDAHGHGKLNLRTLIIDFEQSMVQLNPKIENVLIIRNMYFLIGCLVVISHHLLVHSVDKTVWALTRSNFLDVLKMEDSIHFLCSINHIVELIDLKATQQTILRCTNRLRKQSKHQLDVIICHTAHLLSWADWLQAPSCAIFTIYIKI